MLYAGPRLQRGLVEALMASSCGVARSSIASAALRPTDWMRLMDLDAIGDIRRRVAGGVREAHDLRVERFGAVGSMSRSGDCWDNAAAESFFSTLKTEHVRDHIYASHDDATLSIGEYIDVFYNARRRHSHLGYLCPIEVELTNQPAALAA